MSLGYVRPQAECNTLFRTHQLYQFLTPDLRQLVESGTLSIADAQKMMPEAFAQLEQKAMPKTSGNPANEAAATPKRVKSTKTVGNPYNSSQQTKISTELWYQMTHVHKKQS